MDILPSGEVHQGITAPLAAPDCLLNLLVDAGRSGRVADVGVNFHKEVATYNHRLSFRVIDIRGNGGAPGSHLLAHKLGSDMALDTQLFAVHALSDGHILHLTGDNALTRIVHLRKLMARLGNERHPRGRESNIAERRIGSTLASVQ